MEYDLLVVGNGFDLGCEFKTTYNDFINYSYALGVRNSLFNLFMSAINNKVLRNDEWNGFEKLLCQYLQFIDFLYKGNEYVKSYFSNEFEDFDGTKKYQYYNWEIPDLSKVPNNIYIILHLLNPLENVLMYYSDNNFRNHITSSSNKEYKSVYIRALINVNMMFASKKYVIEELLKLLENRLEDVEKKLKKYISIATNKDTTGPIALRGKTVKKIITFNYSKTAQKVFNINDEDIAYVYGSVDDDVVLGVESSMISEQSVEEESDYIKFFKRFRRIYKDCNKSYNHKIINALSPSSNIAIYGHSLDLSDRSILKPLFENRYNKYDIYCYGNKNEYKVKLAKLIGLDLYDELEKEDKINLIAIV